MLSSVSLQQIEGDKDRPLHVRKEKNPGAGGRSRTDMGLPPVVFETTASAIPPLRRDPYIYTVFVGNCQLVEDA